MDLEPSEEQRAAADSAARWARERLAPGYAAREAAGAIERGLVRELGALGLVAPDLPESLGGAGADGVTAGLAVEAVAAADPSFAYVQVLGSLVGGLLAAHAEPSLARAWVPRVAAGEVLLALALTEPGAGSDAARIRLRARRDEDGYVLDGEKTSISLAGQADAAVVFARTGTAEQGARGVSAFLVPLDAPGVTRRPFRDLGAGAVGRGALHFDSVRVPERSRIGAEGAGFAEVMRGFDYSRALIGLQCLGAARASLDETWAWVRERQAFGGPIARLQGVTFPLAEAETEVEAARWLCLRALWLRDRDRPHGTEAAMAKWWAPKVAFEAIQRCLLTHGHAGYSLDLPHQQRLRDVLGLQIGDGTAQVMKLLVARARAGREAVDGAPDPRGRGTA